MTTARRRARLALTLVGLVIAAIGAVIHLQAAGDSDAADQAAIDASAADWGDALGFAADRSAKDAAFEAAADQRIAEEDMTFGLVLIGIGAAVVAGRWAVRPAHAPAAPGTPAAPAAPATPATPVTLGAPAAAPSVADELAKLAALRDRGDLSPAEFETQKARLLGG